MGASRKMKRAAKRPERIEGTCSFEGCERHAVQNHECLTCEAKQKEEVFSLKTCPYHHEQIRARMKKHALTAHPVNILRAVVAGLKGQDLS